MAFASLDEFLLAFRQQVNYAKTAAAVTVADVWETLVNYAGDPPSIAALAIGNTANGIVPTSATIGFPAILAPTGHTEFYLGGIEFTNTVASKLKLYDRLFHAGAYSFNSNVTLSAQPSFAGRLPAGIGAQGTELWLEAVTAFTGSLSLVVTYTNELGTAGRSTGTVVVGAATQGSMVRIPLAAGDTGITKIESVVGSVATAGTFNLVIMRPLWISRVAANAEVTHSYTQKGIQWIPKDAALQVMVMAQSTSGGTPELVLDISSK